MLPITGCAVLVCMNPSTAVNSVLTVTETSTAGLNSTAQVRVTLDPKGGMGLGMLLVSVTEVGTGTAQKMYAIDKQFMSESTSSHFSCSSCNYYMYLTSLIPRSGLRTRLLSNNITAFMGEGISTNMLFKLLL